MKLRDSPLYKKIKGNRLSLRLIVYVMLIGIFFTIITSVFPLYREYEQDLKRIQKNLTFIGQSYLPSLADSLYKVDVEQLELQLQGMLMLRDVVYLEVSDLTINQVYTAGDPAATRDLIRLYSLPYPVAADQGRALGELKVVVSFNALYQQLFTNGVIIFISTGVQIFLTAMVILLVLQSLVTKHLEAMAHYTSQLDLEKLEEELVLKKKRAPGQDPDELDQVADAINDMRKRLKKGMTQRMEVERALAESEGKLRAIFNNVVVGIVVADLKMNIILCNARWAQMSGCQEEEVMKKSIYDFAISKDWKKSNQMIDRLLRGEIADFSIQNQYVRKNGSVFWGQTSVSTIKNKAGEISALLAVIIDITEKRKAEELMVQTEKIISVGGLAAGVAHEINNPLAGILQNLQLMKIRLFESLPANEQTARSLGIDLKKLARYMEQRKIPGMIDNIYESAKRAAVIVNNMLTFSRKSDLTSREEVDIHLLINNTLELASHDYDLKKQYDFKHISIHRQFKASRPRLICSKTDLEQVFLNLFRNSAHAMAKIKRNGYQPRLAIRTANAEGLLTIEIEDNGAGMPEETCKRVFEPFFTTKPPGVGTGLGLSVSYFIISKAHGGSISVDSREGEGTKFLIRLPQKG